jgi:hypothetical protein
MAWLLALAMTLAALGPATEIKGTVVDSHGRPVRGVPVSAVELPSSNIVATTVSGPDGSFSFAGFTHSGGYGLEARTDSACAFSDAIQVDIGFTSVVRLRLIEGLCQNPVSFGSPPEGV